MKKWNLHICKRYLAFLLALVLLALTGCQSETPSPSEEFSGPVAVVRGKEFCIRNSEGGYDPAFLNGVNIGAAKSGYFPGEFGITEEDYLRWFEQISAMNVRVLRVYVSQMPAFYDALRKFNSKADKPLYLIHGVYMNEDMIAKYSDAFGGDGAIQDSFYADIQNAVDIIHGNADIEKLPGNAGGSYRSDVSQWVIGWILGIEWSADFVLGTNDAHPDKTAFDGTYVHTQGASPFEVFLAGAAETVIFYEMDQYDQQRPVALSNWCTTDPLEHPNEPNPEMEDAVSVDVEHILGTEGFEAGFFSSYHVYPYYPDFLSYDTKYAQSGNPYLAYLTELNEYHTMPVLISEYGIPSSRGIAHINTVTGMSQGHVSEEQQGQWLVSLNKDIRASGCVGGLIFSWQDEWFKRCWNSMEYEDPDRRPYWLNRESPESNFGLLSFEPGEKKHAVTLDGEPSEWKRKDRILEQDGLRISAKSDAAYLYLLIEGEDYDFERDALYVPLDVLNNQGNTRYRELTFAQGAEYLLRLQGRDNSALLVDAYHDVFHYDYAELHDYFDVLPGQLEKNSGCFNPIYLAMNKPQHLPETDVDLPFERFDTGALHCGNGNPESADYDSLADLCPGKNCVEVRLPWMLVGFMDPSQKKAMGDFHTLGGIQGVTVEGIRLGVCSEDSRMETPMVMYSWENWDLPIVHERLKQSYYILQDYFSTEK